MSRHPQYCRLFSFIHVLALVSPAVAQQCVTTPPPKDASVLFDGTTSSSWITRQGEPCPWSIENGAIITSAKDVMTKQEFGDYQLHVEFRIPRPSPPGRKGNGNSGVYLHGHYELQVLDRLNHLSTSGCGAIYDQAAPMVDATLPAEQWQSYDIFFIAPRLDARGRIIKKARISAIHNGLWIHHDREIDPTPGGLESSVKNAGPILLQYHNYSVAYRNIWIRPQSVKPLEPASTHAEETLYNGITLPQDWSPKIEQFTREPMHVPYLDKRPDIVPIDTGRQLFIDDFLIEHTTLHRTYHMADYHPACPILKSSTATASLSKASPRKSACH